MGKEADEEFEANYTGKSKGNKLKSIAGGGLLFLKCLYLNLSTTISNLRTFGYFHKYFEFMSSWRELQETLLKFREERDWAQFHNPKDLALALSIEAAELNELFLWKNAEDANPEKVKEELADVIGYAILLAEKYNFDINQIVLEKINKNAEKYPVEKAKGNARKYDEI